VFWWFERRGELIRLEVLELDANRFELLLISADGTETVETFTNAQDLARRQKQLQDAMSREGWRGPQGSVM